MERRRDVCVKKKKDEQEREEDWICAIIKE
jgi:hypothetical protein